MQGRTQSEALTPADGEKTVESPRPPEFVPESPLDWGRVDDVRLLDGMRAGNNRAFAEFMARFANVLLQLTRHLKVSPGERAALVDDFLDDAAMRLPEVRPVPRNLAAYLTTSFRRRLAYDGRGEARKEAIQRGLLRDIGPGAERVVAETCSEYLVRIASNDSGESASSDDHTCGSLKDLRGELTTALQDAMSDEEWQIIGWRGERMPYRDIAAMLGIAESTARGRVMRVRERLFGVAKRFIATLPADDGIALARSLGGVMLTVAHGRAPPIARAVRETVQQREGNEHRRRGRQGESDD